MIPPNNSLFYRQCTRYVVALCLLLIALPWSVAIGGELVDARQEIISALEAGKTIERQLSGGEAHAFQITLPPGQRLRVIADQHRIDVAIKIFTLQDQQSIEMDSQNNTQRLETTLAIAEQDKSYRVEIRSPSKSAPAGRYELRFEIAGGALQKIGGVYTRQLQLGAKSPQLAALKQKISQLENEFEIVRAAIRKDSPHYDTQVQPLALAELQQQLEDDTLLLEYKLGDERSWLWAITRRTLRTYELPKREQIELAAARFRQHLTARSLVGQGETPLQRRRRIAAADAKLSEAAAALSAMILDPAAGQFAGKRLVIVPDGALHYVAFAALPAPKIERRRNKGTGRRRGSETGGRGDGETGRKGKPRPGAPSPRPPVVFTPLIVDHEIVILPSVSVIATQRRELAGRPIAPKLLAVLADPVFHLEDERFEMTEKQPATAPQEPQPASRSIEHPSEEAFGNLARKFPRLPFTRQEANRIMALVPAEATFKATGFKANRATALDPELGKYRYLHFATHGLLDSEQPELSALALSMVDETGQPQDGFLRVNDIYNLKLPVELVALSGCQTGLGKAVEGEGLVGLARGFMYSGAARVVVSLWNVNDQATSELMARFYQKMLKENKRPAAALRMAQVEMWKQKQWQAPYYWATFILQGEWR